MSVRTRASGRPPDIAMTLLRWLMRCDCALYTVREKSEGRPSLCLPGPRLFSPEGKGPPGSAAQRGGGGGGGSGGRPSDPCSMHSQGALRLLPSIQPSHPSLKYGSSDLVTGTVTGLVPYPVPCTATMSSPAARLKQVVSALTGSITGNQAADGQQSPFHNPNALKFQAGYPKGLAVNHTPLNPVSFLLRSATIRPDRVAMVHPAKNAQWTYAEWCGVRLTLSRLR